MNFKCYLHYSDGLTKNLTLNQQELDETFHVWKDEIDSGELVYLKIKVIQLASLKYICPTCKFASNDKQVYDNHFSSKFHRDAVISQ